MNLLVLQSGGPTAVLNATLQGVLTAAAAGGHRVFGVLGGLAGALRGEVIELTAWPPGQVSALADTPGAVLGSSRHNPQPGDLDRLLALCRRLPADLFLCLGGNGSMLTALALSRLAGAGGPQVIGLPKTVDNDLPATDFSPGYPSAARFVACATADGVADLATMAGFDAVKVLEVMGRDAGWLAAAAAAAPLPPGTEPPLVLVPEQPFDPSGFLQAVADGHRRCGYALVVASEGLRDAAGAPLAGRGGSLARDALGRPLYGARGGVAEYLCRLVAAQLGLPARYDKPGTLQRGALCPSPVDRAAAIRLGAAAVAAAAAGASGVMLALRRAAAPAASVAAAGSAPVPAAGSDPADPWRIEPVPLAAGWGRP